MFRQPAEWPKKVWGVFSVTGAVRQWESRESLGSVCGAAHGFSSEAPMETQVDNEETSRTHKKPKTGFPVPERREG